MLRPVQVNAFNSVTIGIDLNPCHSFRSESFTFIYKLEF